MKLKSIALAAGIAAVLVSLSLAQRRATPEEPSWGLKPLQTPKYVPPHKPHTKLAEVKAKHKGQAEWRELVVDDDHLHAEYISSPAGSKVIQRFHPDTREWWVILDGEMKFDIEGQEPLVASKGSMVQVPMQTIYSIETVGDKPALRFEVNIAKAKTLYPKSVEPPRIAGFQWIPVRLNRQPGPYDHGNVPQIKLSELVARPEYSKGNGNFMHRFVHDDCGVANVIYGYEKNLPALNPKERGHYHPECAEFWLIMAGQIRYPIENQDVVIADEGDVVYAPIMTFHAPRFHGPEPSCRLAMNAYTNIAHLRDAEPPH